MKGFLILATILVLTNFCKSAWSQRLETGFAVALTQFSWTFKEGRIISDVTVCTDTALDAGGKDTYGYSLSHLAEGDDTVLVTYDKGNLTPGNSSCVLFTATGEPKFPNISVIYHLTVDSSSKGVVYFGEAYFAVETKVLTRDCGSRFGLIYRISAAESAVFEGCLKPSYANPSVCYKDNSDRLPLAFMTICYTDGISRPPNLKICQKGLEVESTIEIEDTLTINSLAYGKESTDTTTIILDPKTPKISEVFVVAGSYTTSSPVMCSYADRECTFVNVAPQNILYSVCGLVAPGTLRQHTSVGTIKDFDVFIYADTGLLLDFGFANANPDMWYTATLLNAAEGDPVVDTVNIDCTKVEPTHNCYGFLVVEGLGTVDLQLEVSYNSVTEGTSNTVIVPHHHEEPTLAEPLRPKIN